MAGLTVLIFCTWKHVDYHTPPPPGWISIFCFCGKATGATSKKTTIKQASSGSCGGQFPEAGGGRFPEAGVIPRLVASGGWWHLEAGGIWRLVASRGWWHPEAGGGGNAATTMAGLTFFIFCTWKHVDYLRRHHQVGFLFFVFVASQQVPPFF